MLQPTRPQECLRAPILLVLHFLPDAETLKAFIPLLGLGGNDYFQLNGLQSYRWSITKRSKSGHRTGLSVFQRIPQTQNAAFLSLLWTRSANHCARYRGTRIQLDVNAIYP